jgi:hypothetical protein
MTPDTIYYFSHIPEYQSRYMQISYSGIAIPEFPSVYKKGKYKGEKYIIFRRTSDYYNQGNLRFSHALELAKSQIITKLIFLPNYPRQTYGTYKNYALLIEFTEDFNQLTIMFFKGLQEAAPLLFQKKQAGQIPEITKSDKLKLRYKLVHHSHNKLLLPPTSNNVGGLKCSIM